MVTKFFVTVFAPSKRALADLRSYDFDLLRQTTVASIAVAAIGEEAGAAETGYSVEGLLTAPQIERLVTDGYQVLVRENAELRARARTETISFEEWLQGMEEG